jgi:hypothetical protein
MSANSLIMRRQRLLRTVPHIAGTPDPALPVPTAEHEQCRSTEQTTPHELTAQDCEVWSGG